jgi:hypothetical protein
MARAVEDVCEMEREAWCSWMLITGALVAEFLGDGGVVDPVDVHAALAVAADVLDEHAELRLR